MAKKVELSAEYQELDNQITAALDIMKDSLKPVLKIAEDNEAALNSVSLKLPENDWNNAQKLKMAGKGTFHSSDKFLTCTVKRENDIINEAQVFEEHPWLKKVPHSELPTQKDVEDFVKLTYESVKFRLEHDPSAEVSDEENDIIGFDPKYTKYKTLGGLKYDIKLTDAKLKSDYGFLRSLTNTIAFMRKPASAIQAAEEHLKAAAEIIFSD